MQLSLLNLQRSGFFARMYQAGGHLLDSILQRNSVKRYRPEKHYMRGPGPKTRQAQRLANRQSTRPANQAQVPEIDSHSRRA
jgi:hypothetical protein